MPRRRLNGAGDFLFHVLNRGAARQVVFRDDADYADFQALLDRARRRVSLRLFTYCLMPTHLHLVLWPADGRQLPLFMQWLTGTFAMRWHVRHGTGGRGAVFQGRYKALPVQAEGHFLRLCRYVDRNPVRAGLVDCAERWPWSGLGQRGLSMPVTMDEWPIPRPADWAQRVNAPDADRDLALVRRAVAQGCPLGDPSFLERTRGATGLPRRRRGRPRKLTGGADWESGLGQDE